MTGLKLILSLSLLAVSTLFDSCHSEPYQGLTKSSAIGVYKSLVVTYHPEPKSFYDALQHCAIRNGGLLASASDAEEVNFIANLVHQASKNNNEIWVGGLQVSGNITMQAANPIFVWLNTEKPIDSSLWAKGFPISAADPRRCAILKRENLCSQWNLEDNYCNAHAPFLCAKSN